MRHLFIDIINRYIAVLKTLLMLTHRITIYFFS